MPSVTHLLHFGPGMGYECSENAVINGIPTKTYKAKLQFAAIEADFDVTYHWSGKSVSLLLGPIRRKRSVRSQHYHGPNPVCDSFSKKMSRDDLDVSDWLKSALHNYTTPNFPSPG